MRLPVQDNAQRPPKIMLMGYPILAPHELLALMYERSRAEFDKFVLGPNPLSAFWQHLRPDDPRMLGHPVKQIGDYQNKVVPLRIHGDGVPIGKAKT